VGSVLAAVGLYGLGQLAVLASVYLTYPRFFYLDDKQVQYIPVFHWLGERVAAEGRPTLVDPDQGMAGAFAADLQYGVLDPAHWLIARWVSSFEGLNAAAWGLSGLAVLVLGTGSVVLARALGARPWLAASAGVGASSTGFLLWIGASWWPAVWASAFVPWLLWGLLGRRWWTTAALAPVAYLMAAAGYPYVFFAAGVVVLGAVVEGGLAGRRGERRPTLLVGKLLAGLGGSLAALPGLLLVTGMAPYTGRSGAPDVALGNEGAFIPNALDVLLSGPTLLGSVDGYWGLIAPAPLLAAAWFAVPGAALVDWRRAWLVPGVPTLLALVVVGVLMTQLPTYVGGFRYPFRYLAIAQPAAAVLLAVALSRAPLLTRRRLALAAGLLLAQALLSVARAPDLSAWHIGAALLLAAGTAALVLGLVPNRAAGRRWRALAAAVALAVTVVVPWYGIRTSIAVEAELSVTAGRPVEGLPATPVFRGEDLPASVQQFEDNAWQPGLRATVISWGPRGPLRGLANGILDGSANLLADVESGFGYTSLGQAAWQQLWCTNHVGVIGISCGDALDKLLRVAPGTDQRWVDLLSQDRVLLSDTAPPELRAHFDTGWRELTARRGYTLYERPDPLVGRVTWRSGVETLQAERVEDETQAYTVGTGPDGGSLVLRDPWWPGYVAELDGREIPVESVDGVSLLVRLPADVTDGRLTVTFAPSEVSLLPLAWTAAVVVAGAGLVLAHPLPARRRTRAEPDRSAPAAGTGTPAGL
jgi:hypothetical protein